MRIERDDLRTFGLLAAIFIALGGLDGALRGAGALLGILAGVAAFALMMGIGFLAMMVGRIWR